MIVSPTHSVRCNYREPDMPMIASPGADDCKPLHIIAAALGGVVALSLANAEPTIRGKTVADWIVQLDDLDPHKKVCAADALGVCGSPCSVALPSLRAQYRDPKLPLFASTAFADSILRISDQPETEVITFLTDLLDQEMQKPYGRLPPVGAIRALGTAGSRAKSTVQLLRAICPLAGSYTLEAGRALAKIDGSEC